MSIKPNDKLSQPGILSLLKPYSGLVSLLILFALFSNGANLWLPKIISHGIDGYTHHTGSRYNLNPVVTQFTLAVIFIFIFTYFQSIIQTYTSEKVARDLRTRLSDKITRQNNSFIEEINPSKLLTNLTGDRRFYKAVCIAGTGFHCFITVYHYRCQFAVIVYQLETGVMCDCHHSRYRRHFFLCFEKSKGFVYAKERGGRLVE